MNKVAHTMITAAIALFVVSNVQALSFNASDASIKQHEAGHLLSFGETAEYVSIQAAGEYRLRVHALGIPAGGVWPVMALSIDGLPYERVSVVTPSFEWTEYVYTFELSAAVHTVGVQYMNDAFVGEEDRNLGLLYFSMEPINGAAAPVKSNQSAWMASGSVRDNNAVSAATTETAEHRMAPATIVVRDKAGKLVNGATIEVEQITSDFLFGASIAGWKSFGTVPKNDEYAQRFEDVFNFATLPFFWPLMEPAQGVYYFDRTDDMVNWAASKDMALKGHAPLWYADYAIPSWANGVMPSQTVQRNLVDALMNRYSDNVKYWEMVNEPYNNPGEWQTPHFWARENDSTASIILNEYGHFYQGFVELLEMAEEAIANGTPIDVMGIQAHAPTDMAFPLEFVRHTLDQFASLGVDLHITEFTPPSSGIPVSGATWRGNWTEAVQAEYAEAFYRVCFGHPAVKAISWWDFSDHGAWEPGGGLLRADLSPKPAYNRIKDLVTQEWRTAATLNADANGAASFDGYHGRYRVTVTYNGEVKEAEFHLNEDGSNALVVTLEQSSVGDGGGEVTPDPVVSVNSLRTRSALPTLSGSVQHAENVFMSVNGNNWYPATISDNSWSLSYPVALADGIYDVQVEAENAQGVVRTDSTTNELIVDRTKPVLTVNGERTMTVYRGTSYNDAGASAHDNIDGNISHLVTVNNPVNTSVNGTYYVTYNVSDLAGNTATIQRKVVVKSYVSWFSRWR